MTRSRPAHPTRPSRVGARFSTAFEGAGPGAWCRSSLRQRRAGRETPTQRARPALALSRRRTPPSRSRTSQWRVEPSRRRAGARPPGAWPCRIVGCATAYDALLRRRRTSRRPGSRLRPGALWSRSLLRCGTRSRRTRPGVRRPRWGRQPWALFGDSELGAADGVGSSAGRVGDSGRVDRHDWRIGRKRLRWYLLARQHAAGEPRSPGQGRSSADRRSCRRWLGRCAATWSRRRTRLQRSPTACLRARR